MTTATDLISRALRVLTIIPTGDAVPSDYSDSCLLALNTMMARWEADGITTGWANVTDPNADLAIPIEAERGIAYNLAVDIAAEFGFPITDLIAGMADADYRRIQRDALLIPINSMAHLPGESGYYNIYSDDI